MKLANFSDNQFVDNQILDAGETLTRGSLLDITGNLHTPGLIGASNLSFSYSGLNVTVNAPLPFHALFSDGTLASANGTTDGESSSSATVDFSSLLPSTGSITAYLVAVSGSIMQEPYQVIGPPQGHPDFSSSFAPYTAYSEQQDTIQFQATTTEPDNLNTLFIASTVLSAGQTVITSSSTTGQVRAGAILSRNGEVLAADLASGAAATNVGTLGGSLVGTLPNPTLASTGATSGTYINPISVTVDSDGRISAISNVDNFDVPGNVTAGGDIVASGTVSGASATSNGNLIPYGQAFQLLTPTASETITLGNTLETEVQPSSGITADITLTLEPGSVEGQGATFYGSASASGSVTVASNVTTGSPYIELPDGSQVYSWTIPAASPSQGIRVDWDGTNWRARTFGATVVAPATSSNKAVNLGQLFIGNRKSVFTANGTFTVPSAVTTIWVSGCGGGGGGGGGGTSTTTSGGGGGGGGGAGQFALRASFAVAAGDSLSVTIGAAGAGAATTADTAATAGSNGTSGGNTVLTNSTAATTLLTLTGGGGGGGGNGSGYAGGGGGAGYPAGGFGGDGSYMSYGGEGGSSPFGGGGCSPRGAISGSAGFPGQSADGFGAGGSGGGATYAATAVVAGQAGGNGSPGYLIIEW